MNLANNALLEFTLSLVLRGFVALGPKGIFIYTHIHTK